MGEAAEHFVFNVRHSVGGRAWTSRLDETGARLATQIAQRHSLPDMVSRVLAARGVSCDTVDRFWDPSLKSDLPDPSTLTDMDVAAARIADAITGGERIALFGDYDVDGATSTALMTRYFRSFGIEPLAHIPDRITEGYGPSATIFDRFVREGASLAICLDCGATSIDAIERGRRAGLDIVVVDHHQVGSDLPPANALVNPNRQDDLSGQGHLAAVGVTFLVCVAVSRELRRRGAFAYGTREPDLREFLDLVALGTVCDVVPLTGVNRAFVKKGLLAVTRGWNRGLGGLCRVARLYGSATAYQLGYMLGPRINAGGRIGKASLGLELLTSEDDHTIESLAQRLDDLNRERQTLESLALEQAIALVEEPLEDVTGPIVVSSADWHPGIVGLVASRLCERSSCPAVAIAVGEDGKATGSARSVPGFDLGAAVRDAVTEGLLIKGGGHEMAAGLTVSEDRIDAFRDYLAARFVETGPKRKRHEMRIDAPMTAGGASLDVIGMLEKAGPYGAGHPAPLFAFPAHRIAYAEPVGGAHIRLTLATDSGDRLSAMAFRALDRPLGRFLLDQARGGPAHFCGTLSVNTFRGEHKPQLSVLDAATPVR